MCIHGGNGREWNANIYQSEYIAGASVAHYHQ